MAITTSFTTSQTIGNTAGIKDWVIYKITSPSGRVYIGKTSNYQKRLREHKHFVKNGRHSVLSRSYKKYGFECHKFEILDSFSSDNEYCQGKEMFWIRSYMSNIHKYPYMNGLNMTDGGDGQSGRHLSDESRKKISDSKKGKKISDSHKEALLKSIIGNKFNLGRKQSKELIERRIKNIRGRKFSEERLKAATALFIQLRGKPVFVLNIETNEELNFSTIRLAAKYLKVDRSKLSEYLRGKNNEFSKKFNNYIVKFK